MNEIRKIFWETIKIFKKNNVLKHVVLIGSWAEHIYEVSDYLKDFKANLKTKDIDFDEEKAPLIKKAFELYATGKYTLKQIAKILKDLGLRSYKGNILSVSCVQRILKSPFYYGIFTFKNSEIINGQTTETEVFSNLPVTPDLKGQIILSASADHPTTLSLDTNNDGTIDQVLWPSFIFEGEEPKDTEAPEATIEFDPNTKDLKFTGQDRNQVTVIDNDDLIMLMDDAGNTTEIQLKEKDRKRKMKAEIKSIKYNGTIADISKNSMAFLWVYDRNGNLKMQSQHIKAKNGYNILAIYNGKKTRIIGRDANGLILKSFNGLKIIKVTTNKGDLSWSY